MTLKERLAYWAKRLRSGAAALEHAKDRRNHFDEQAKEEHEAWRKAKKAGKPSAAGHKAKAQRATRKAAYWDEQVDVIETGVRKWRKRVRELKRKIKIRHELPTSVNETTTRVYPDRPWNPNRKPVAAWFVPLLDEAWERGWRGYVVSGVRTPAESVAACQAICQRDSCSGTCAGVNSNHNCSDCSKPHGAVDVTDYYTLASIMRQMGNPIFNDLPLDRVHFSATGH